MPPTYSDLALLRRLLSWIRPYRLPIAGILLLSLLSTPLTLLAPLPLKIAVDTVIGSEPLPTFLDKLLPAAATSTDLRVLVVATVLSLLTAILSQCQILASSMLSTSTAAKLVLAFRAKVFRQLQRLSLSYHDSNGTSDSIYRLQYDASAIRYLVLDGLIPLTTAIFTFAGMLYITFILDWQIALVALAISPPLFIVGQIFRPLVRNEARGMKRLESSAFSVVQEVLTSLRVVRAFGQEDREQERFVRQSDRSRRAKVRLAWAEGSLTLVLGLIVAAGTGAVLFLGARNVMAGSLTLGELLLVMAYVAQLYRPLRTMSRKVASLQRHLVGVERMFSIMDRAPDVPEIPDARPLSRAAGSLALHDVTFAYDGGDPVLRKISLEIPAGARVGIMGETGSGKTTLVNLLSRFYDPTSGHLTLDGVDLREYRLADLRAQFAIVLQDPMLFSTTIAENIAYADPNASEEAIVRAATAANAHDFIVGLRDGYDTQVGERGLRLSGGERQRIALARAFLKDAPVVIMDEPTSAVDVETEAGIIEAMKLLMQGRTCLLITHRESALAACDRMVVIKGGKLLNGSAPVATARRGSLPERTKPMARLKKIEILRTGLLGHPSVRAWGELGPRRLEPEQIDVLKGDKKSSVYRLAGVGPGGSAVIAKRCKQSIASVERAIYENVLPDLPVTTPRYYGWVEEEDEGFCWLFLEEATGEKFSWRSKEHRVLAARWLGTMHTAASGLTAAAQLPDRGPSHYLEHVRTARANILRHFDNPVLDAEDRDLLEKFLSRFDLLESNWSRVEALCAEMPRTLVHGDVAGKNAHVRLDNGEPILIPYDWEMAGWGVPAVDLLRMDLDVYGSVVADTWPGADALTLQGWLNVGKLLRGSIAPISWQSLHLAYEWAHHEMAGMKAFYPRLNDSIRATGMDCL